MPGIGIRTAVAALRRLPVNALSRAAGRVAEWRLPGPLQRAEIRLFAALTGADPAEARDPIDAFPNLQQFFTRALQEGARPIDPDPEALVSPCDGAWGAAGTIEAGTLLQLKGRPYSLAALLGSEEEAGRFEGGPFATLYLGPRDYHRFHMPCAATPTRARYLPGRLWPVNRIGVEGVDGLFAENERIVAHFTAEGGAELCLVAVGATVVGKVRVNFDTLTTQAGERSERRYEDARALAKGEEWGRFEFGSTLVLAAEPDALALDVQEPGTPLRLGTRIGTLTRGA